MLLGWETIIMSYGLSNVSLQINQHEFLFKR